MKTLYYVLSVIFVLSYLSCNKSSTSPTNNNTITTGQISFSINMANAPSDVTYLKGSLTRAEHDTVHFNFTIENGYATALVQDLITGNWLLNVDAYNAQDIIIYTGSTDITIFSGQTTTVQLHLNPTTGSISIIVTWGNPGDYALSFDGIDDMAIVTDPDSTLRNINSEITLTGWIYVRSFPNMAPRIIDCSDNRQSAPNGDRFLLTMFEPLQCVSININGFVVYSNPINLDQWYHVAGTYDGQTLKIYVNGELEDSSYVQTSIDVKDSSLYVGNNSINNRQFDGMINSLSIWNKALGLEQIQDLKDFGIDGVTDNLITYWPFDESSGQTSYDIIGINHLQLGSTLYQDDNDPTRILLQ